MTVSKWIRIIFSVFVLGMIALFITRLSAGLWMPVNWGILAVAALSCLLVFRNFVYIFNFSYALACIANGILIIGAMPSVTSFFLGGAIVIYGIRLWAFTKARTSSESYAGHVAHTRAVDAKFPPGVKIALWLQCSFLYTFHIFPIYMAAGQDVLSPFVLVGAGIMILGTVLEGIADSQKQAAKAADPDAFVTAGLYARWRHPNYLGEILLQLGLMIIGISAVTTGWMNYLAVTIAPLYILMLMVSESLTKDSVQIEHYGHRKDYQAYLQRSSSLLARF